MTLKRMFQFPQIACLMISLIFFLFFSGVQLLMAQTPGKDVNRVKKIKWHNLQEQKNVGKSFTFQSAYGTWVFTFGGMGGACAFTPSPAVGNAYVGFIQVARSGDDTHWFTTTSDIKKFTTDVDYENFLHRTDPIYGFRVDKTKFENVPFFGQEPIKKNENLNTYKYAFNPTWAVARAGETAKMSDNAAPHQALKRTGGRVYRFHFIITAMNLQTGQSYGAIEWGMESRLTNQQKDLGPWILTPSLIDETTHPDIKGRDGSMSRWNTIFRNKYKPRKDLTDWSTIVFPIPGEGVCWNIRDQAGNWVPMTGTPVIQGQTMKVPQMQQMQNMPQMPTMKGQSGHPGSGFPGHKLPDGPGGY